MTITSSMIDAMMKKMDEKLLNSDDNVWRDACELARYGIAHEILEAALKSESEKVAKTKVLLKRVYDLINNGEGKAHLEVAGEEAMEIFGEIKQMRLGGELA